LIAGFPTPLRWSGEWVMEQCRSLSDALSLPKCAAAGGVSKGGIASLAVDVVGRPAVVP